VQAVQLLRPGTSLAYRACHLGAFGAWHLGSNRRPKPFERLV